MKTLRVLLLACMALALTLNVAAQKQDKKPRIKSIIVLEEEHDVMIKKQVPESETYYDERGNVIEEKTYKKGKLDKHFKYQWDADDNKIREEEYDAGGKLIEYSEYRIENGLRVEKKVFDPNKKLKSRKIYQYTTF